MMQANRVLLHKMILMNLITNKALQTGFGKKEHLI